MCNEIFIFTHQNIQKYNWYSSELHPELLHSGQYHIFKDLSWFCKNIDQLEHKAKPTVFSKLGYKQNFNILQ